MALNYRSEVKGMDVVITLLADMTGYSLKLKIVSTQNGEAEAVHFLRINLSL